MTQGFQTHSLRQESHIEELKVGDSSYSSFSISGRLSSEKVVSMHDCILKPILEVDSYPTQEIFKNVGSGAIAYSIKLVRPIVVKFHHDRYTILFKNYTSQA